MKTRVTLIALWVVLSVAGRLAWAADPPRWAVPQSPQWQVQLSSAFDTANDFQIGVKVYIIDAFDNPAPTIASITAAGAAPICHFSAGTVETGRPDKDQFNATVKGSAVDGAPDESWLDIRSANVRSVMRNRILMCKSKGYVAVVPDRVDAYTFDAAGANQTGFNLQASDQLDYNQWLAAAAHAQGLAVGLKNDMEQISVLVGSFDFFLNERCQEAGNCAVYAPAKAANKPILQIEYSNASFAAVCRKQRDFGVRSIWKDPALTSAPRRVCWFEPLASDGLRYQYQLGKAFDPNPKKKQFIAGVSVYFLDGDGTSASTVAAIRAKGFYPVCYFSAGSWENYRDDKDDFPPEVLGNEMDGWPDEKWVDIRSDALKPIMKKRMELCKSKGFVAVDPDNVDAWSQPNGETGFSLSYADQIAYNRWLAATAHALDLGIGLKNDLGQLGDLVGDFDFFVNEQCQQYRECGAYAPVKAAGKPVWAIEYKSSNYKKACKCQQAYGIVTTQKKLKLDTTVKFCSPKTKQLPNADCLGNGRRRRLLQRGRGGG